MSHGAAFMSDMPRQRPFYRPSTSPLVICFGPQGRVDSHDSQWKSSSTLPNQD